MRCIKYILISIIIVVVLVASGGCLIPPVQIQPPQVNPVPAPATTEPPVTIEPPPPPATTPMNPAWSPPVVDAGSPILPDFVSVIAQVKPSVVAIKTKVPSFNIFTGSSIQEGAGSGWIISEDGYIVTNNHVVEGAESIDVILDDGRTFTVGPEVIRADSLTDMAVIKIDATGLPAVRIGDSSELKVGQWVIAIGNSLGLGISATKGIVSALKASLPVTSDQTLTDLIQTDAAINPGNSGGPLVNLAGEVIGINSIKVARVGVEGMGYSISSNGAIPIIEQLIKSGVVVRAWLGVSVYTVDEFIANRYNLAVDEGAIITQLASSGPAVKGGLKLGDVITAFGDAQVTTAGGLVDEIHTAKVGETVRITYWRGKNQQFTDVVLAQRPN